MKRVKCVTGFDSGVACSPRLSQQRLQLGPLLIRHVARIPRLVRIPHGSIVVHLGSDAYNNDSKGIKLITVSSRMDAAKACPERSLRDAAPAWVNTPSWESLNKSAF